MTEVPEHLLRRSRERKAQAAGGTEAGTEAGAPATEAASGSSAVEPAAAAAPATRGGGGAPVKPAEPSYVGPPQPPPRRPRLPLWAMPVVVALPFWALLYTGSFGERGPVEETPITRGAAIYTGQGCSTCHGARGEGGVGPAMDGVNQTFPDFADHVAWVKNGSAPVKGQPYGATGRIATGGMPSFDLPEEDIIAVVCHERVTLGGGEITPECEAGASPDAADTATAEGGDSATTTTAGGEGGG